MEWLTVSTLAELKLCVPKNDHIRGLGNEWLDEHRGNYLAR